MGVRDPFIILCYEGAHSSTGAAHPSVLTYARPIVTVQRERQRSTWVATVSKHDPFGRSFSSRTSPPRCPRGQSSSEWNVSIGSILNKMPSCLIVSMCLPGRSTRLVSTVMSMCGVRAQFIHIAQKCPNVDNIFRQTPRNSSGTLNGTSVALRSDGFSESCKTASTPLKLRLPAPTRSIR